jgi:hypothetical protein
MLTIEKCRKILGSDCPESDTDLEKLREHLYSFARVAVEILPPRNRGSGFAESIRLLPEDERYEAEERAAILEYDGGFTRNEAERLAFSEDWRLRHRGN